MVDFNKILLTGTVYGTVDTNVKDSLVVTRFILGIDSKIKKNKVLKNKTDLYEVFFYGKGIYKLQRSLDDGAKIFIEGKLEKYYPYGMEESEDNLKCKNIIRALKIDFI